MQLNLFQWDMIEIGKGNESLARLDFAEARRRFLKVLRVLPEHPQAGRGMRDLQFWEEAVHESDKLDLEPALCCLWDRIQNFPFGNTDSYRNLRRSLLGLLLVMMTYREALYIPPDLCRGYLHLQLDDFAAATAELSFLLERVPGNGRLRAYLADALWLEGKKEAAAATYVVALLTSPGDINTAALRDRRVAELVREHGPGLASIYGYMAGALPLVMPPGETVTPEAQAYKCLYEAEQSRARNEHQAMVTARRDFKKLAPSVFQDYLDWLATGETTR